ncbi:MAG: Nif3-like dinuclear metal center hexameric protein [Ruminobacter sp.]|nr:Nif3-like dinuclear metal center hexameric protein [Ruminobacter sp.]MDY5779860.1 Nif3-like dinuclear metal center hexameric protein [Succinivibrionaceae bacterium]
MKTLKLDDILKFCDNLLDSSSFKDASFNGLQVENTKEISKIVTGVSATKELFERAKKAKADLVITHHGLFWKGADPRLVGVLGNRVKALGNMSLMAYHLPLDAHKTIGNNAKIAQFIEAEVKGYFPVDRPDSISIKASYEQSKDADYIVSNLKKVIPDSNIRVIGDNRPIKNMVICSGEGAFNIDMDLTNIDAVITGEMTERYYHLAFEKNINIILLGHHYSEVFGIIALGEKIKEKFGAEVEFIDVFSPF